MKWDDVSGREIPTNWEIQRFSDLLSVTTGKEDANFATSNGKYKFFTCSSDTSTCDISAFSGSAILIAGNGDFNVKHFTGEFNAYQRTYVLIPNDIKYYAAMYIIANSYIKRFKAGSYGSIVKFITKGDVENMLIPIPDNKELFKTLNNIIFSIENNKKENDKLVELRDWLLPMLMNGQATIKE